MDKKIVLVGNPNVGKSIFFNDLTGAYVDVSNFPGTTVDISIGKYNNHTIIDTPGVYGISSFNDEERVTKEVVLSADLVINVVDATNLERDLFLTLQLLDMGKPLIIALNMVDEAKKKGIEVDVYTLSNTLGVEVIPTVAIKKKGLDRVKKSLAKGRIGVQDRLIEQEITPLLKKMPIHEAILYLEEDPVIISKHRGKYSGKREEFYLHRRKRVDKVCEKCVIDKNENNGISSKLGYLLVHPFYGVLSLIGILGLVFIFIGDFVSQRVVDFTEGYIMGELVEPGLVGFLGKYIDMDTFLGSLLIGEFGVFTLTITYLMGLLLPLVLGFYFVMSIMEDSGYLPRVAVLLDKLMTKIGLNGKGIIPIILGFGCVTMATITTRILGTQRERTIATFLLAISIPCSAQLGVIVGLLAPLGGYYIVVYILVMVMVFIIIGKLLSMLVPGKSSPLLLDLPPLRLPRMKNVIKKTYHKTLSFLQDAAPLFALGAMIICILQFFGILAKIQAFLSPLTVNWLQLPKETANVFIMGLIRRDFGTAGLYSLTLTAKETIVALTTITLFVPCIASVMVILKERGVLAGIITVVLSIVIAFTTGGIVAILI